MAAVLGRFGSELLQLLLIHNLAVPVVWITIAKTDNDAIQIIGSHSWIYLLKDFYAREGNAGTS